jgi:hypothetical protein
VGPAHVPGVFVRARSHRACAGADRRALGANPRAGSLGLAAGLLEWAANFQTANAVTTGWPRFDAAIGNPPYLGAKFILAEKDPAEVAALKREYPDIGGTSDYVSY